jgi:cyclopropane-fatty-acyl-phospholipid synthase
VIADTAHSTRSSEATFAVLDDLLGDYRPRNFGVRLWDGSTWDPDPGPARFTLVLRHPGALRRMFVPPGELSLAEAYIYGDFDVEGSLEEVFPVADHLLVESPPTVRTRVRAARRLARLPRHSRAPESPGTSAVELTGRRHSLSRDRVAVSYHYDRSNEFFAAFLDPEMVYSCAYFTSEDDELATAQARKLDYLCRKLRLRPGDRLLDIGCGWGGLLRHAVSNYGVEALGITLSQEQAGFARERIQALGIGDRCRVELRDYRELDEVEGFDKLVSVGMFEHVADDVLGGYFEQAWRLLRPGGTFLNHGISRPVDQPQRRGPSFIQKYVFPEGELVPVGRAISLAEQAGFEVRDVESLREHYVLTLGHWLRRLDEGRERAIRAADEVSFRVWRLYMSGSAYGFETGRLNVHQTLLAKPDRGRSGLPLVRADWYAQG